MGDLHGIVILSRLGSGFTGSEITASVYKNVAGWDAIIDAVESNS
jgi:hypothetical protein